MRRVRRLQGFAARTVDAPAAQAAWRPERPRGRWRSWWRFAQRWVRWVRTVTGAGRPADGEALDRLRREYERLLADGVDRFFEPRRPDCPVCGSTRLEVKVRTRDLQRAKPGEFVLEECQACGHLFQNPCLSLEGIDFYYRDADDVLTDDVLERVPGHGGHASVGRARMLEGYAEPRRWLDVGAGHGTFCLIARRIWPDAAFDGIDLREGIEAAERRGWVDRGYRGRFADMADELAGRYDVVSMLHHLEHTRDPFAEIDAAARALAPGGHLLIEVPDPSPSGRLVGRHWIPWFQPRHQHLLSADNLEWALGERGFTPIVEHRGEAHHPVDLVFAVSMLINRLAPPTDLPWQPPASPRQRARRAAVCTVAAPILAAAFVLDHLLAVALRHSTRSNTYRVLARRDEAPVRLDAPTVIDLRDSVSV